VSPALYATLWIALGFLCGSIPFGYVVARAKGMDIRSVGSGNIGMTNVWRALGAKFGILVLVLDALKGWLPVFLYKWLLQGDVGPFVEGKSVPFADTPGQLAFMAFSLPMLIALAAVLGHTFSPWMRFKGGKGVATGLGVIIALFGVWSIIPALVFVVTLAATRYVSLGSILGAATVGALPFIAPLLDKNGAWPDVSPLWPFGILVALLVLWTHRENIKRILSGSERKVGASRT
jgi:glycerol-3-phosphate acyltransferase PlsY